LWEKLKKNKNC